MLCHFLRFEPPHCKAGDASTLAAVMGSGRLPPQATVFLGRAEIELVPEAMLVSVGPLRGARPVFLIGAGFLDSIVFAWIELV
ncbi:MAG: hypothetical protein P8L85_15010 [Rubripirellula sp.]|nr:hypothetical protein [Rubripirellula sp.]